MGIHERDYWKEDHYDKRQYRNKNNYYSHIRNITSSPIKTIFAVIAAIIIGSIFLWFIRIAILGMMLNNIQKTTNNAILNLQTQSLESQTRIKAQLAESQKKQREQELVMEAERIAKLPADQRDALKRNLLWKQQYIPPSQCVNSANAYLIGECMKFEKAARARFEDKLNDKEAYWNGYYSPPTKCQSPQSALQQLECKNESDNMRRRFEQEWQAKINSGWRPQQIN